MKYLESQIQKNIIKAVRYMFPKATIFSIPNEGKRNLGYATSLKQMGMLHGTSDLICLHNFKVYFFEVKAPKKTQTPYQKEFEEKVKLQGHQYHVVRSADEVLKILQEKN